MLRTLLSERRTSRTFTTPARCMVAIVLLSGTVRPQIPKRPTFESYRVATSYQGVVKPPDLGRLDQYTKEDLHCFGGGDPASYADARVNFAGHFVVGACTCGTGCHYLFMWDAESGKFYRNLGFGAIEVGPYRFGKMPGADLQYAGEEYRVDSALLILDGCFEDTCDCARRYYVWGDGHFTLVLRQLDRLPPQCQPARTSAPPR